MQTQSLDPRSAGRPDPSTEEAQFRARMARLGTSAPGRPRPSGSRASRGGGFRLGWKSWTAINILAVLLVAAVAVAWPPVSACRQQDKAIGFYAGDNLDKCVRRGVSERLKQIEQRMTMLVRGSGH